MYLKMLWKDNKLTCHPSLTCPSLTTIAIMILLNYPKLWNILNFFEIFVIEQKKRQLIIILFINLCEMTKFKKKCVNAYLRNHKNKTDENLRSHRFMYRSIVHLIILIMIIPIVDNLLSNIFHRRTILKYTYSETNIYFININWLQIFIWQLIFIHIMFILST